MPNWLTEHCLPLIADVHGHAAGLRRVLADIVRLGVTRPPLLLGDLFWTGHPGRDPRAVLDLVRAIPLFAAVRGNTDDYLVSGRLEAWQPKDEANRAERAAMLAFKKTLDADERKFLSRLPLSADFTLGASRCRAAHASPADPEQGLILNASRDEWLRRFGADDVDVLITGHLHRAFTHFAGRRIHVCVAAVGRTPDEDDGIAEYALLDATPSGLVVIHQRVPVSC